MMRHLSQWINPDGSPYDGYSDAGSLLLMLADEPINRCHTPTSCNLLIVIRMVHTLFSNQWNPSLVIVSAQIPQMLTPRRS
ncbi:hypothetical protein B9Z55_015521 [Caenorhabditis nigoni]|uniref:Uncharacterized protein n=1 Tax=Caenorhabditis nigoni TaxID=1611254 RepID=A0A2G5UAN5_9PELO|nr:hypothetical protein B9Z55_015521 [Caenorhabditis nigoni]